MRISDFDFPLPEALIAQYPAAKRSDSRLLEVSAGVTDRHFTDLTALLRTGDLLVFNDTRVIPARLHGRKDTGGRVEILIERITGDCEALALVRASKTPKRGSKILLGEQVEATVEHRDGEMFTLRFSQAIMPLLHRCGEVPLPPYLKRPAESADGERYQTVYAKDPGAVAAPTAGLHFDLEMMDATLVAGARHAWVTLHVGAGTFQPLRHENIAENRLHSERVQVDDACCDAVNRTRAAGGRVIAVGTTSVRALECATIDGALAPFTGETDLFILPGYRFQAVDAMITNFHLPQSSLLMLVAAFAGTGRILDAYNHAVREKYRFFSYGDAMFLTPEAAA
ncbi:MAG: tRNA preQ1(34) S-adenosylmethionine ribosyltransferase-isomerase QueA [Proteobacteria bacterium]|nr:tRNA preQ1(34) S-adenosylmethionine ribosyltransferase-isomerase QueA [Pseudomonadota bacterium]